MNKPKAQGTAFESLIVRTARTLGLLAQRLAEGGSGDGGDVYLGKLPATVKPITVLAWKRLVPQAGATRRRPDGEPTVFVLDEPTFWYLIDQDTSIPVIIECKSTERLNVTRALAKAKGKVDRWWVKNRPATGV